MECKLVTTKQWRTWELHCSKRYKLWTCQGAKNKTKWCRSGRFSSTGINIYAWVGDWKTSKCYDWKMFFLQNKIFYLKTNTLYYNYQNFDTTATVLKKKSSADYVVWRKVERRKTVNSILRSDERRSEMRYEEVTGNYVEISL